VTSSRSARARPERAVLPADRDRRLGPSSRRPVARKARRKRIAATSPGSSTPGLDGQRLTCPTTGRRGALDLDAVHDSRRRRRGSRRSGACSKPVARSASSNTAARPTPDRPPAGPLRALAQPRRRRLPCHREFPDLIERAGFTIKEVDHYYIAPATEVRRLYDRRLGAQALMQAPR